MHYCNGYSNIPLSPRERNNAQGDNNQNKNKITNMKKYIIITDDVNETINRYIKRYPQLKTCGQKAQNREANAIVKFAQAISYLWIPEGVEMRHLIELNALASEINPYWA